MVDTPVQLWSKNGGLPQKLPFQDVADGVIFTDLANNPEGRALCGWAEAGAPQRVSRMQMRLALAARGWLDEVEGYIYREGGDKILLIYYEDVSEIWRNHPMTVLVQNVVGKTDFEMDQLFIDAKQIV